MIEAAAFITDLRHSAYIDPRHSAENSPALFNLPPAVKKTLLYAGAFVAIPPLVIISCKVDTSIGCAVLGGIASPFVSIPEMIQHHHWAAPLHVFDHIGRDVVNDAVWGFSNGIKVVGSFMAAGITGMLAITLKHKHQKPAVAYDEPVRRHHGDTHHHTPEAPHNLTLAHYTL